VLVVALGAVLIAAVMLRGRFRSLWAPAYRTVLGRRSASDALARYGEGARQRFLPRFAAAGVPYPPPRLTLVGLKAERQLELWAEKGGGWAFVHAYPILGASGIAGPKLREGDRQVPEGIYRLEYLNPDSNHHLSMKITYPNAWDRRHAEAEGRTSPGSDIFIHGGRLSIGCIAIGDRAIEELFVMVQRVGIRNVEVILAPNDLRRGEPVTDMGAAPAWLPELYRQIRDRLGACRIAAPAPTT